MNAEIKARKAAEKTAQKVTKEAAHDKRRPHISDGTKAAVWVRDMGEVWSGKCPVSWCHEQVKWTNFVLAHDVPFSEGGATDGTNLFVTCARCNLRMSNRYTVKKWKALPCDPGLGPGVSASGAPADYAKPPATLPTKPPTRSSAETPTVHASWWSCLC